MNFKEKENLKCRFSHVKQNDILTSRMSRSLLRDLENRRVWNKEIIQYILLKIIILANTAIFDKYDHISLQVSSEQMLKESLEVFMHNILK